MSALNGSGVTPVICVATLAPAPAAELKLVVLLVQVAPLFKLACVVFEILKPEPLRFIATAQALVLSAGENSMSPASQPVLAQVPLERSLVLCRCHVSIPSVETLTNCP